MANIALAAYPVAPCNGCGQDVRLQVRTEWAPGRGTFPAHFFKVRHPDATGHPCINSGAYHGPYRPMGPSRRWPR